MLRKVRCILLMVLVAGLLICPALAAAPFPDMSGYEEFTEAVEYVSKAGIMVGDGNGDFNPYNTVTRAEMATIICRMLNVDNNLTSSAQFNDVPIGHWANGYVSKAASLGIVKGYDNGNFGPLDAVTYEQAVTMVIRAFGVEPEANELGGYPDGHLAVANKYNLLEGVCAEKGEPLSRSDIAIIICNCMR